MLVEVLDDEVFVVLVLRVVEALVLLELELALLEVVDVVDEEAFEEVEVEEVFDVLEDELTTTPPGPATEVVSEPLST